MRELAHFAGLGNVAGADPDGDGLSTADELARGFDPTDAVSPLQVEATAAAAGTELRWPGREGRRFSVLRADRLEGPFAPIATGLGGSAGTQAFRDPQAPAGGAFYHVRAD